MKLTEKKAKRGGKVAANNVQDPQIPLPDITYILNEATSNQSTHYNSGHDAADT
jgi:hypothetical protein